MFKPLVKLVLLPAVILLLATLCTKKLFRKVTATGKVLHFFTRQPVSTSIALSSDNKFSGSSQDLGIASGHTDAEGNFTLKGRASKAGTYYLSIGEDFEPGPRSVQLKEGEATDLGTFFTGSQTIHCKVLFIPDSGKCLQYYNNNLYLGAGTYSTAISSRTYKRLDSLYFYISYAIYSCSNQSQKTRYDIRLPVTGPDTLNYTVRY